MRYTVPVAAALLLGVGETHCIGYPPPYKHFVPGAHQAGLSPQASCLRQIEGDTDTARADAARSRWSDADRDIAAIVTDEHQVEMDMPVSSSPGVHLALADLRRAVFKLAAVGHDRTLALRTDHNIFVCCRLLDRVTDQMELERR